MFLTPWGEVGANRFLTGVSGIFEGFVPMGLLVWCLCWFSVILGFGLAVLVPSTGVSPARLLGTHKLGGGEVEQLLDAFDFLGDELARAVLLLGEFGFRGRVADAERYEDTACLE